MSTCFPLLLNFLFCTSSLSRLCRFVSVECLASEPREDPTTRGTDPADTFGTSVTPLKAIFICITGPTELHESVSFDLGGMTLFCSFIAICLATRLFTSKHKELDPVAITLLLWFSLTTGIKDWWILELPMGEIGELSLSSSLQFVPVSSCFFFIDDFRGSGPLGSLVIRPGFCFFFFGPSRTPELEGRVTIQENESILKIKIKMWTWHFSWQI